MRPLYIFLFIVVALTVLLLFAQNNIYTSSPGFRPDALKFKRPVCNGIEITIFPLPFAPVFDAGTKSLCIGRVEIPSESVIILPPSIPVDDRFLNPAL